MGMPVSPDVLRLIAASKLAPEGQEVSHESLVPDPHDRDWIRKFMTDPRSNLQTLEADNTRTANPLDVARMAALQDQTRS